MSILTTTLAGIGEQTVQEVVAIASWTSFQVKLRENLHMMSAIIAMALPLVLLASPVGAQTLTVPLKIEGPRIFVTVRVNDKTARLLVDTGSEITLVEPQFAKGTIELKRANIQQQTGIMQASIRELSVTLGELTLKDLVVGVLDMTDVKRRTGTSMDGLLGEDILRRFRSVRINFKDKTLELER